jgi:hypothetical protein
LLFSRRVLSLVSFSSSRAELILPDLREGRGEVLVVVDGVLPHPALGVEGHRAEVDTIDPKHDPPIEGLVDFDLLTTLLHDA